MISIILPTYNESENILKLIRELFSNVKDPLEVVVVDDNSPDGTWEIAERSGYDDVRVIRRMDERGLATAINRGITESRGDIIGWMDADACHPPTLLPEMIRHLDEYDAVIGSRYIHGGKDARGRFRVFTSRLINWFAGLILGFDIKDYDSGFILMKKGVLDNIGFPSSGYGDYFIELMFKSKKAGFRIKEVPYTFRDREEGQSKTAGNLIDFFMLGSGYLMRIIRLRCGK